MPVKQRIPCMTKPVPPRFERGKPQSERRSGWRRPAGILLVVILLILSAAAPRVAATTTSEALAKAKQQQAELEAEQDRLAKEKAQLSKSLNNLSGQLAWLNARSEEQKKIYLAKTEQLEAAYAEMAEAYAAYGDAVEDLENKQQQYVERMQTMFEHQHRSLLEVFLEADSLQGFFTTLQFMIIVADTDQQLLEQLEAAKDQSNLAKGIAEQKAIDLSSVVTQLEADLAKLKADAEATEADMNQLELKLNAQAAAEEALSEESMQVAAEVAQLQQKLSAEKAATATAAAKATQAAQQKKTQPGTTQPGWVWPYPSDHTVYSPYGMRWHPIYHRYMFHSGVDLGGTYGYPIVAAHDATVLLVRNPVEGRNTGGSGYGNYIVLDHGDGYCTLYAHLKNTLVRVGQVVHAGDKIATCGSTGTSTGPHLHFEVILNGSTVNPLDYVK
jgi:murein DD-endopeptidase MepM/ murein hydrolase activator NlpD